VAGVLPHIAVVSVGHVSPGPLTMQTSITAISRPVRWEWRYARHVQASLLEVNRGAAAAWGRPHTPTIRPQAQACEDPRANRISFSGARVSDNPDRVAQRLASRVAMRRAS